MLLIWLSSSHSLVYSLSAFYESAEEEVQKKPREGTGVLSFIVRTQCSSAPQEAQLVPPEAKWSRMAGVLN